MNTHPHGYMTICATPWYKLSRKRFIFLNSSKLEDRKQARQNKCNLFRINEDSILQKIHPCPRPEPGPRVGGKGRWQRCDPIGRGQGYPAGVLQLESVCLIGKRKCWLECVQGHILSILASHLQAQAHFHTHIPPGVRGRGGTPPGPRPKGTPYACAQKKFAS
jgi:hypothetical protein